MLSSQVSSESNTCKDIESENLRAVNVDGPDESEHQDAVNRCVTVESKYLEIVQVDCGRYEQGIHTDITDVVKDEKTGIRSIVVESDLLEAVQVCVPHKREDEGRSLTDITDTREDAKLFMKLWLL
jgi:3-deoxy-D-arabino-heptulosonate 7-phosphate (DAHP) synthase